MTSSGIVYIAAATSGCNPSVRLWSCGASNLERMRVVTNKNKVQWTRSWAVLCILSCFILMLLNEGSAVAAYLQTFWKKAVEEFEFDV